jgi:3-hydroxyacyl-[acyl-carrier-protein] dehydratase
VRFHLVDRIDRICYGKFAEGVKCVSLADDVFNEHFPGYPVFPGTLVIESMAQLGGSFFEIMMKHLGLEQKQSVLTMVNRIKFKRPVEPGDKMHIRVDIKSMQDDFGVVAAQVHVEEQLCAQGELTFSFIRIDDENLHASRKSLYAFCTKNTRIVSENASGE